MHRRLVLIINNIGINKCKKVNYYLKFIPELNGRPTWKFDNMIILQDSSSIHVFIINSFILQFLNLFLQVFTYVFRLCPSKCRR